MEAFESLLSNLFILALKQQTNWGCLSDSHGIATREEFLSKLTHFVSVLNDVQASLADLVNLSPCKGVDVNSISGLAQIIAAANNSEILEAAEKCAIKWCKEKLAACKKLNEEYQRYFHHTNAKLQDFPSERPFDFYEIYIFGRFDTFCRRLLLFLVMYHICIIFCIL